MSESGELVLLGLRHLPDLLLERHRAEEGLGLGVVGRQLAGAGGAAAADDTRTPARDRAARAPRVVGQAFMSPPGAQGYPRIPPRG